MVASDATEEAKECPHDEASSPFSEAEVFLQNLNNIVVDGGDTALDPKEYRNHYETLLGALKLAHTREVGLADKCRELHTQNAATANELQTANRSNQGLESQVGTLQKDVDTLRDLVESANVREERAKGVIDKLQDELERLTDLIDKSEVTIARKDCEAKQLRSDLEDWKSQASSASDKVNALEAEQQMKERSMEQLRVSYAELGDTNSSLKRLISEKEDEIKRCNERRERVENELEDAQSKLRLKSKEFIDEQYKAAVLQNNVTSLEKQLSEAKKTISLKEQDLNDEAARMTALTATLDDQKKLTADISRQLGEASLQQKKASIEFSRLVSDKTQLERNLETERKAILRLQQQAEDAKAATSLANADVQLLNKELETMRRRENQQNRDIMMLKRENAVATGRIKVSEDKVKKSSSEKQKSSQIIVSLEKEVADAIEATSRQELVSRRLEGECDSLRLRLLDSQATSERYVDEIKLRDSQHKELLGQVDQLANEIDAKQKEHDAVKLDMNHVLKDLTDAQREIKDLEQDKRATQRLVDTLRSEITTKDSALVKEHHDYMITAEKSQRYADEISRLKKTIGENEAHMRTHQSDARRLGTAISKLEDEAAAQKREHDHVINERDILGTQLIRRNDEIALLYEKIKICQSTHRRGELQYNARLDDIRILKIKLRDLQRQLAISQGGQAGVGDLSRNLLLVQKELTRERLKVKALSDELENPLNVHRWRKLEGSDPQAFELIQKISILQKRLLAKSEEVATKKNIIRDHENNTLEMEKALARKPGPEVAEQLNSYQEEVRTKTKQMKAMAAELNMQHTQVQEYKREIDKLATELHNFKRKYFEQKRRETLAEKELVSGFAPSTLIKPFQESNHSNVGRTRFVGGGFAIK